MPATLPVSHVTAARQVLAARVLEALEALGDTHETVAAALTAAGHRGAPCDAGGCPVADWLRRRLETDLGCVTRLTVGSEKATVTYGAIYVEVRLPGPVARFVHDFDQGCYGALLA